MAEQNTVQIVKRMFDAWNAHDVDAFAGELDAATVWESESLPASLTGHDGARELLRVWHAALPDLRLDIQHIVAGGENVVVRFRLTGTHKGAFMGVPPTGKTVRVPYMDVWRIADGRIVENWVQLDMMALTQQLGCATRALDLTA